MKISFKKRLMVLACVLSLLIGALSPTAQAAAYYVVSGVGSAAANTDSSHNYSGYWQYWSQGGSKYKKMRDAGCRVVAQSKLLAELGAASRSTASFNPDVFLEWGISKGHWPSASNDIRELTATGSAAIAYAAERGYSLARSYVPLSGTNSAADIQKVMDYIKGGYYVILHADAHQAYVGRGVSLSAETPVILDSWYDYSYTQESCRTYAGYNLVYFTGMYAYAAGNASTPAVSASFGGSDRQSIGETDAVLACKLTVEGASIHNVTAVGITLFDAAGEQLAVKIEPVSYDTSYIEMWYGVRDELGVSLSPETTYQYQFRAVIGGKTYYSTAKSFTTSGTAPTDGCLITLDPASGTVETPYK